MCGIVGMAGGLNYPDEQRFKLMLLLDYFRGQDSTGIAVLGNDGRVNTLKVADDPIILMKHQDFETVLNGQTSTIFLGHNRASTIGASTRENAHPFTHGKITGVHNGTLTKECKVDLTVRVGEHFATDSETVFAHINKFGIEDTIPRLVGAWALVYIDSEAGTLNMIRNAERPLWLATKKNTRGLVLMWASEYEMIEAARSMTADKAELVLDKDGYAYVPLDTDLLHTWEVAELLKGVNNPTYMFLEGAGGTPPKVTKPVGFQAPTTTTTTTYTITTIPEPQVTTIVLETDEPLGGLVSENEWNYMASYGCSFCGTAVQPTDAGLMVFTKEQIVLCSGCSDAHITTVNGPCTLEGLV